MAVACSWAHSCVIVIATPAPPQPTSARVLIEEKSCRANSERVAATLLALIRRRNASNSSVEELEKSILACGTPVRIDGGVLSPKAHGGEKLACRPPMKEGMPFTRK